MMQKWSLLFESEQLAQETVELLWDRWGVRGEIELVPLEGQFKLDIIAETDLTGQQIEQLPGKRA